MSDAPPSPDSEPENHVIARLFWPLAGIFWIMLFAALKAGQSIFVPIFLALVLALIFSPVRRQLARYGLSSLAVASVAIGTVFGAFLLIAILLGSSVQQKWKDGPTLIPKAVEKLETITGALKPITQVSAGLQQIEDGEDAAQMPSTVAIREPSPFQQMARTTPSVLGQFFFVLILAFALIASGEMFYEKIVQIIPHVKDKQRVLTAARDIERNVSSYLLTITVINATLAVIIGIAMWGLGLPDALVLAVLSFFLNFIPYIGALILEALAFILGILFFDSVWMALAPPLVIWAITMIEGQVITPLLVGKRLQLNVVAVFLSLALWGWLWGIAGMLLAMPILLATKRICESVEGWKSWSVFLGPREDSRAQDRLILKWILRPEHKRVTAPADPAS